MKPHVFKLHFLVLIWGFTAILGKLISLPSVEIVFYRTLLSSCFLYLLILVSGKTIWKLPRRVVCYAVLTGAIIAGHWILFFLSARISNVSICLVGMATGSLWTAFLEPIWFKKPIKSLDVFLASIALAGMAIVFQVAFEFWLGLVLAIISALLSAVFTVINAELVRGGQDHYVMTFLEMLGATVAILLFFPFYAEIANGINLTMGWVDLSWMLILVVICTVYAYSASVKLMLHVSPFQMNLTVNLEPVYGILLAAVIFHEYEQMKPGFYLGAAVILLSILVYPILNKWLESRAIAKDGS